MTHVLEEGIIIQVYRDKVPGHTTAEKHRVLGVEMDKWKALGVKGVAWHGFTRELIPEKFSELTKLCTERGMKSYAAFGLDSSDPVGKGTRMAAVANVVDCAGIILDMEGAWEDEIEDKETAIKMGEAFRKDAPNALVIDQPWFDPRVHWSKFPWKETAKYIDIRAPQVYAMDFRKAYGKDAYEKTFERYKNGWEVLEKELQKQNLVKPRIVTIQGYFWQYESDRDVSDLINCLLNNDKIIIWSEPFPTQSTLFAISVVNKLKILGFVNSRAVENFQKSTNGKLKPDNICGEKTLVELGL